MLKKTIFVALSLCFGSICLAQVIPAKDKFHIYLLIGQSNMAGRGKVEPQDTISNSRVLSLNKANQWVVAKEPVGFDKPSAGVGPGLAFGREMAAADTSIVVGLIPCAQGGSGIDYWQQGVYWSKTNSYPLDYAISRTKYAMDYGTLKGIIWNQGESDCTPEKAVVYGKKLQVLIDTLRLAFNAPDLPFIAAELPAFQIKPKTDSIPLNQINQAINELKSSIKYYSVIKADNTTHKGDTLHYNSASARLMGKRYAGEMIRLLMQKP
jgi:hypothetical protein